MARWETVPLEVRNLLFFGVGAGLTAGLQLARHAATRRENLPASPMRAALLDLVAREPGIMFSELRARLRCSPGTVQHHVNLLEKEQFLVSVQSGRRRRLFLADTPAETRNGVDLLRNGRTWQLIQSVLERPGLVQKDITDGLAISRKVLRGYLDRLSQQGLVREVPRGRFRSYYPSDALFNLVQGMRGPAGPAEPSLDEPPKPENLKPRDPLEP
ncbi:MAG: hypothetical protein QOG31_1501 [Thermoplasmata archaeon]|jgi:predicted transcriptional regulator|nr:hypothetical protein [Thermoplasmata archaeon]